MQLHTRPGDHTYSVWRPALRESLRWALVGQPQNSTGHDGGGKLGRSGG